MTPRNRIHPAAGDPSRRTVDPRRRGTRHRNADRAQILARSSNVGAVTIGLSVGATKFSKWIERFGFGKPTGVQFPGEEKGIVPKLSQYSGSTMGNLPMGQGAAVTPMQMVPGLRGDRRRRHPAAAAADRAGRRRTGPRAEGPPRDQRRSRRRGARNARGGARAGRNRLGGERPRLHARRQDRYRAGRRKRGYSKTKYVASFIGFAPAQDPKFLAAVIVDQPQGEIYGGSVAAPAFGEIAAFCAAVSRRAAGISGRTGRRSPTAPGGCSRVFGARSTRSDLDLRP